MRKMKIGLVLFCLLIFITSLSSCVPLSKNPLGKQKNAILDSNLIGTWKEYGQKSHLIIAKSHGNTFTFTETYTPGLVEEKYWGYVSDIRGRRFLNLKNTKDLKSDYLLAHYTIINNKKLVISFFDLGFFKKAIQDKAIKGEITPSTVKGGEETIRLTATTRRLKRFIRKNKNKEYLSKDPSLIKKYKKVRDN
jgi:hypothetical protein